MTELLKLALIDPDPDNVRDNAFDADINGLAEDIRKHGLINAFTVYSRGDDAPGRYMLLAGERRYHACRRLGLTEVECQIRPAPTDSLNRIDLMYGENEMRKGLNPIELALVYRRYVDAGLSQGDTARRLGVYEGKVSQYLDFLRMDPQLQQQLRDGKLSPNKATQAVKRVKHQAGGARPDMGSTHKMSAEALYFGQTHPAYQAAYYRCHSVRMHGDELRFGGACGECWEFVLNNRRDDHWARFVEHRVADPLSVMRQLKCVFCKALASERGDRRCSASIDGKIHPREHHEFVLAVRG